MSKDEILLTAILNDTHAENIEIISRVDKYLEACCMKTGCEGLPAPVTRIDALLYELAEKMKDGGAAGGNKLPIVLSGQATTLTAVDLEGVPALRDAAFEYYYALQSIEIPESVASIGTACFSWCIALTSITIPANVTALPVNMLNECRTLATLELHANITSIGDYAFRNTAADAAEGLTLTMHATTPPTIGANTFLGTKLKNIIVPAASLNTYKTAANWATYANYIISK